MLDEEKEWIGECCSCASTVSLLMNKSFAVTVLQGYSHQRTGPSRWHSPHSVYSVHGNVHCRPRSSLVCVELSYCCAPAQLEKGVKCCLSVRHMPVSNQFETATHIVTQSMTHCKLGISFRTLSLVENPVGDTKFWRQIQTICDFQPMFRSLYLRECKR